MYRKVSYIGVLTALALILSYIESLIPFAFGIPGMKLGLTNIIVVIALYELSPKDALLISFLRILLAGFMFGNAFSIIYSLAGGLLSFLVMWGMMRLTKLSLISVSVCGGISHNLGQILIAMLLLSNYHLIYYFVLLSIAGFVTGLLIGIISNEVIRRIPRK